MLIIIITMLTGILIGRLLRERISSVLQRFITILVWLLLFILGAEAGGDERIVNGFSDIGAEALAITLAAMAGSILFSWLLWLCVSKRTKEKGREI